MPRTFSMSRGQVCRTRQDAERHATSLQPTGTSREGRGAGNKRGSHRATNLIAILTRLQDRDYPRPASRRRQESDSSRYRRLSSFCSGSGSSSLSANSNPPEVLDSTSQPPLTIVRLGRVAQRVSRLGRHHRRGRALVASKAPYRTSGQGMSEDRSSFWMPASDTQG
jgi:hypothetical protein